MSGTADRRYGKSALIIFENKRNTDLGRLQTVVDNLASYGYYFDKISRVAYSQTDEIVGALSDGLDNFDNTVILCPAKMGKTIADFVVTRAGSEFDNFGVLNSGRTHVFMIYYDRESRLQYADIKSILDKKYGIKYDRTVIRIVCAPKQLIDDALIAAKKIFEGGNVYFNITDDFDDCRIEVVYSSETPKMLLDDGVREIVKRLNDYVYAMEDITLAEQLFRLLKLRRMKIAVAESFTGGGVCKKLVEVSGISEVFSEGMNTYSNQSKMNRLGVSELTLNQRGAVSAETAYQMAEGLIKAGSCDVSISTTGIAGPKSDNTSKPVGLAYIGIGIGDDIAVYKFNFAGDREKITKTAINHALFLAYKRLK